MEAEILDQEDYEVHIGSFNGPMDLLVYLVQKKEMTLDKIPIAEIADDFLKRVNKIGDTDLSKAGDFLFMASRLMALKVQELLPAEERDPELVEEYNADREQLMKEMLEYQRYKQVAGGLQEMEGENFGTFSRGRLEKTQNEEDTLADANIWQLFRAYQKSLKTKISETVHHIELDYVTIQDRQQSINNFLAANGRALFEDLLDNDSHPIVAAVTFMAMLEMIKTDEIVFRQSELFGPIWIYRKKNNPDFAEEMARETVFFSKDPDVKPGLVEEIRNMAVARSQTGSVGDIAAVMKEAVLWTTRGRNVSEDDLQAMLEGREDLSEVSENPFADMIKEADAAEGISQDSGTDSTAKDTGEPAVAGEPANAGENAPAENTIATAVEATATESPTDYSAPATIDDSIENSAPTNADETEVETTATESPVEAASVETEVKTEVETTHAEDLGGATEETKKMTDEEFAEFMRKAQAFYDAPASVPETTNSAAPYASAFKADDQVVEPADKPQTSSSSANFVDDEPFSAGNEMTDAEYIAYLNRSAKASRKKDNSSSGIIQNESDDEEGPVIYGAND